MTIKGGRPSRNQNATFAIIEICDYTEYSNEGVTTR